MGTTPLARIALRPGPHQIRLAHPDYLPVDKIVRVEAGQVRLIDETLTR